MSCPVACSARALCSTYTSIPAPAALMLYPSTIASVLFPSEEVRHGLVVALVLMRSDPRSGPRAWHPIARTYV